jgi:hypothetical protein
MTDADTIRQLGNTCALAADLGVSRSRVSNWKKRGIPWRERIKVARLAKERGLALPADFLVDL